MTLRTVTLLKNTSIFCDRMSPDLSIISLHVDKMPSLLTLTVLLRLRCFFPLQSHLLSLLGHLYCPHCVKACPESSAVTPSSLIPCLPEYSSLHFCSYLWNSSLHLSLENLWSVAFFWKSEVSVPHSCHPLLSLKSFVLLTSWHV